jgi:hypothetical protein
VPGVLGITFFPEKEMSMAKKAAKKKKTKKGKK